MLVCVYEDRATEEPGVRLLIASLARHDPEVAIRIYTPAPDPAFVTWVAGFPSVTLDTGLDLRGLGWNAKPTVLLAAFQHADELVWLDSDVIVTGPIRPHFERLGTDVLVATEEALWGSPHNRDAWRARAWGFPVARSFPFTLNTAVLRITRAHLPLIEEWQRMLSRPDYVAAQALPTTQRPAHMVGDQDAVTALLSRPEFADIPIVRLRRGREILQLFGLKCFTLRERAATMRKGLPTFVHSQGAKPWRRGAGLAGLRAAYLDTSPYKHVARQHLASLSGDTGWMHPQHWLGRALVAIGFGRPALTGLPLATLVDVGYPLGRFAKRLLGARGR